jgi:TetR/AcrR family transcriptional regulator, transcriptional repressor for nem operon
MLCIAEVLAESDLREYIEQQMSVVAEGMIVRHAADNDAGVLPEEFNPQIVVPVLIAYLQGMWRMARCPIPITASASNGRSICS